MTNLHRSPLLFAARRLGRREWPILLCLMVPAAAIWVLLELADEVREGSTAALDEALLLLFRNPIDRSDPLGPPWLQEMMRDFTALGGVGVLSMIALAACGYLILLRKRRAALAVLLAVAGGVLISQMIKAGIDRPRPDLVPHGSYVSTASFPSGHSMMAATVYLTLAVMLARVEPRWRSRSYLIGCAMFIVMLVGVSRVYLGVHWPTDVLAGWSVGAGWAIGCWGATLWLQRRGTVESDGAADGPSRLDVRDPVERAQAPMVRNKRIVAPFFRTTTPNNGDDAMADQGNPKHVWEMMEKIGMCMLASKDGEDIRSRPMAAHVDRDERMVYFLTDAASHKDEEIARNPAVCLAFADPKGNDYVSVSGHAVVSNDRAKIRELFSTPAKAWWDDAEDPEIRVLKVQPNEAQYWDGPGRVMALARMLVAAASDSRPEMGDNAKVRL